MRICVHRIAATTRSRGATASCCSGATFRPGSGSRSPGGFTLVELLISISLFMALAFVLYTFISGGVNMWRTGERRQDLYERAEAAFETMARDLWCTFRPQVFEEAAPVAMFLADRPAQPRKDQFGLPSDRSYPPILGSRLRFVRTIQGEFENPLTRNAGRVAGASAYYQTAMPSEEQDLDEPGQQAPALKAPAGLKEVIYQAAVLPGSNELSGTGTLLRGERMPVGGAGSLFKDDVVDKTESWPAIMRPVVHGVLYMGLEFWDQTSDTWANPGGDVQAGAERVWDSSRGLLKEFLYYRQGSASSDIDDVYPERLRITLILARPGDTAMTARLRHTVGQYEKEIQLDRPGGLQLVEEGVVLVGGKELMTITRTGVTRAKIVTRGAYGTQVLDHAQGVPVVWGDVFTRVVNIPCYREYHN